MSARTRGVLTAIVYGGLLLCGARAVAQERRVNPLHEVDPDAPEFLDGDPPELEDAAPPELPPPPAPRPTQRSDRAPEALPLPAATDAKAEPTEGSLDPAPRLRTPLQADAELKARWREGLAAARAGRAKELEDALQGVLKAKAELGVVTLDAYAMALVRVSRARQKLDDPTGAVNSALAAVALAPALAEPRFRLAGAYAAADPAQVGRILRAAVDGAARTLADTAFFRSLLFTAGTSALLGICATAVILLAVFWVGRGRMVVHDAQHLLSLSAGMPGWQAALMVGLLMLLPVFGRLGLAALVLLSTAALALYLTRVERVVMTSLLLGIIAAPWLGGGLVARTSFAGTVAEQVSVLAAGAPEAEGLSSRLLKTLDTSTFEQQFTLGHFLARRARFDEATVAFRAALEQRPDHGGVLLGLGNVMAGRGDYDSATAMFESAVVANPRLVDAHYNLARLSQWRALWLERGRAASEVDRAQKAINALEQLDPALAQRLATERPPDVLNQLLRSPALPEADVAALAVDRGAGERVQSQLARMAHGKLSHPLAPWLHAFIALLVVVAAEAGGRLERARPCAKCQRPLCRRCDRELAASSQLCAQCVNVFNRERAVAPADKIRKQIEVAAAARRRDQLLALFSLSCSGAGHVFLGLTLRGASYVFGFSFGVAIVWQHWTVWRPTYDGPPGWLWPVPLMILIAVTHALSVRGALRRPSE